MSTSPGFPPTSPLDPQVRRLVRRFDPLRRECFEERAAIVEEGNPGLARRWAERLAVIDVLAHHGLPSDRHLLAARLDGTSAWFLCSDPDAAHAVLRACGATDLGPAEAGLTLDRHFAGLARLVQVVQYVPTPGPPAR